MVPKSLHPQDPLYGLVLPCGNSSKYSIMFMIPLLNIFKSQKRLSSENKLPCALISRYFEAFIKNLKIFHRPHWESHEGRKFGASPLLGSISHCPSLLHRKEPWALHCGEQRKRSKEQESLDLTGSQITQC